MVSNILFSLSLTIATLALLDIYLSDRQKSYITDATTRMWSWLDDMGKLSFLELLRQSSVQWGITLFAATVAFLVYWYYDVFSALSFASFWFFGFAVACLVITPGLIKFTLSPCSKIMILVRAFLVVTSYVAVAVAVLFAVDALTSDGRPSGMYGPSNLLIVMSVMFASCFYLLVLCLTVITPLVLVALATAILAGLELTVRRIIEYPKGPILAGSAIVGVVVMVIKAY